MTGCDTHGELLGGYVLGSLSPEEMEEMRLHLETCPSCARQQRALAGLPALLDRIEPSEVPPPVPPPALEEAILDRWTREHRRASRPQAAGRRRGRAGHPSRSASAGSRRRLGVGGTVAAALGAVAIAAVAVALLLPAGDDPYARGTLAGAAGAGGSFTVEQVPAGTKVRLEAQRLPPDAYEVWCVREDGRWISGGSFRPDTDGRAAVTLTAAVTAGDYHTVVVTRGARRGERGAEMLQGTLEY